MKNRLALTLTGIVFIHFAATAAAGPPLVCHPWVPEGAPKTPLVAVDMDGKLMPGFERELFDALDREPETLVRLQMTQRVLLAEQKSPDTIPSLLAALKERYDSAVDPKARAERRLDWAVAAESARFVGDERGKGAMDEVVAAAKDLRTDAAAWLAVARTKTPLMNSGTDAEHARAFLRAYDMTAALPDGKAKLRLEAVLAWDLDHLEAYLLDGGITEAGETPSPKTRLAALRRHAESK